MPDRRTLIVILIVILFITLPFIFAFKLAGNEHVFSGFLVNPLDGNSYLAKMMEGFEGKWVFTLPYSSSQGQGAYIFLFYLFLGHLARITGLSLVLTFHLSRILAVIFLFYVLFSFLQEYFGGEKEKISLTLMIVLLGAGMGWLLIPFGIKTSDLWVAEAFPFLSTFQNPHFPLGLGLMLLVLMNFYKSRNRFALFFLFFCGLVLAIVLPFGAVVIGSVIFFEQIWAFFRKDAIFPIKLLLLALGSLPVVIYQYYVINSNPELAIWNSQNLTPSPPLWDFFIAFLPALILAGLSIFRKPWPSSPDLFYTLTTWLVLGAVIIYLPIGIQRRFMVGYYLPVSILACTFLLSFSERKTRVLGFAVLLASTSLTLIFVLMAAFSSISTKNPLFFLSRPEYDAMQWLDKNSLPGGLALADSRMGMFLPAYTRTRVIYGHPFETVNAKENKKSVDNFFNCSLEPTQAEAFLANNKINYIFSSNLDLQKCYPSLAQITSRVFRSGRVSNFAEIYEVK
jgi:hypothetical protein